MHKGFVARLALVAASLALTAPLTAGVGDLLVAPTRLVLNGGRGTEVILKNIGSDTATYRISAELRRMNPDGSLVNRQQFLEQTARPVTISGLEALDVNVRLLGDVAIIHARTSYVNATGEARQGRYTDIWARRDGRWLAVAAHVTR